MRRGGPSVHATLRRAYGQEHLGDSLAILAGDLACAQAWALLLRAPFPEGRAQEGYRTFVRMQQEVVLGQHLDLIHSKNVAAVHRLKTGSYTVPGPLRLGALLADASEAQIEALVAYGEPLGEAFQIRDDLLGTFGDPEVTGKGIASDLREGKHTALIAEAERSLPERELAALRAVLGRRDASEEELLSARAILDGEVRQKVEASTNALVEEALQSLREASLDSRGLDLLRSFAERIAVRDR
jgi:geranylgeranyl diphosphate synthase type I